VQRNSVFFAVRLIFLVFALIPTMSGCDLIVEPHNPRTVPPIDGAVLFIPPPRYQTLWQELLTCSGLSGSLGEITWFKADAVVVGGTTYVGFWWERWNRIVLRADMVDNDRLVKHEMMHALLQDGAHPAQYFNGACGSL
jgi:hypothetical protein